MTDANTKILIVDGDDPGAEHLQACLTNLGYTVCAAVSCGRRAIANAAHTRPDLALVDLGLAGEVTGPEVGAHIGSRFDVPVVYLTDEAEGDLLQRAAASNPFGYVLRPFDERQLQLTIETAAVRHARERRQRETEIRLKRQINYWKDLVQRMKIVFDSMREGVVIVGGDRVPMYHNASARRICGDHLQDIDIDNWAEKILIFQPDQKTLFSADESSLKQALSGQLPEEVELFIRNERKTDGIHVSVSGSPLTGKSGVAEGGAVIVFRDITKLKQAEAELEQTMIHRQHQAQLMETVFGSIADGVVAADAQGKFTMFNASAEQIVGVGKLDLKTEQWADTYGVFYPDEKTRVPTERLPLVRAIRGEPTDDVELFIRNDKRPDGVFVSVSGRPLDTDGAAAGGGVIVFRDVTRQKQAAAELETTMAELRYQSELMDTAFKSISDGVVVANAAGEFLHVNPAAEQIVGMGATDGPQDEWDKTYGTYHPDRETPMATEDLPLIRAIHRGESVDEEDVFIRNRNRPDGVYIRVSARPLLDKIGGIRGGVIIFRDVTERVFAEEALALAFAEGRLEIVDTILHNIGNAITSVTTGIETVRRNLVSDRLGRRLGALAAAIGGHRDDWIDYLEKDPQGRQVLPFIIELAAGFATHNEELIKTVGRVRDRANHIADIVRTQKALGTSSMDRKDIGLHEALAGALRVMRDSLAKRGIRTSINCRRAPREIRIRESQFHQMLVNLIKNAIEAIDDLAAAHGLHAAPRIRIRAYTGEKYLNVDVSDNGIGIRTKDTRVLFAPGYTTKPSGSGLGLHSAANFVVASGGRIEPVSEGTRKGTTMRVMLPLSSVVPAGTASPAKVVE